MNIHEKLAPYVQAATDAGYTVHVPTGTALTRRRAGFVYVTRDGSPGMALMQVPTHAFEPISVDIPVKPSKVYGSLVTQDHDGSIEGVLSLLDTVLEWTTVVPRFVGPHAAVPVEGRIGFQAEVYA